MTATLRRPTGRDDVLAAVRAFAEQEVRGREAELDALAPAPLPLYERFRETGLMNWWLPHEHGGLGLTLVDAVDVVSELAHADAGVAFTLFLSVLGTSMVSLYGSPELAERHLGPMARSGGFCATLGSEQEAGSELTRITTTARRDGDEIVLSGGKFFSTNTDFADFLVVVAADAEHPGAHLAVVVDRSAPGVEVVRRWDMAGLRASGTYQVDLHDVRVPVGHALAGPGLRVLEAGLNASRILIAVTALGVARRVRDLCLDYARTKQVRGAALAEHPVFVAKLGQMEMQLDVMRSACLAAAAEWDDVTSGPGAAAELRRRGTLKSALTAKMFCGQTGWTIASVGSEMFGGLGYVNEWPMAKLLRDMRFVSLVEGGDDVLRELVHARYVVPASRRA